MSENSLIPYISGRWYVMNVYFVFYHFIWKYAYICNLEMIYCWLLQDEVMLIRLKKDFFFKIRQNVNKTIKTFCFFQRLSEISLNELIFIFLKIGFQSREWLYWKCPLIIAIFRISKNFIISTYVLFVPTHFIECIFIASLLWIKIIQILITTEQLKYL